MNRLGNVYTYRKQEPVNKGYGLIDPSKVFYKEDPNGKIIIDGVRCSITNEYVEPNTINIGGKTYKTVKIGNQTWLAENLDYTDDNIVLGTDCLYYNDDADESYGLLYIGSSVSKLDSIVEGWHVPTQEDYEELITFAGGSDTAGEKLKSTTTWSTRNGTDDYGFDGKANGIKTGAGFNYKGTYGIFWSKTVNGAQNFRFGLQDSGNVVIANFLSNTVGASIRLVKD